MLDIVIQNTEIASFLAMTVSSCVIAKEERLKQSLAIRTLPSFANPLIR